jgi:5-amino-6-(5-phosphoribosylamino)uracil reductase
MRVISNTAISLDGRINTAEDRTLAIGSKKDHAMMNTLRAQADAVLIGGATFRRWPQALYPRFEPESAAPSPPIWNVVVTRHLPVLSAAYLGEARIRPLFLTPAAMVKPDFPAPIEAYAGDSSDLPVSWILEVLERRGIKTLLVEAGGDFLFQLLAADALDEMYVTLCPRLIGGTQAPSIVDGPGFTVETMRRLKLEEANVREDEIFLRYRVMKGRYGVSLGESPAIS